MQEKYAELLLKQCLKIKKGQPLLISAPVECHPFVEVIAKQAYKIGVTDIYFDWEDEVLKKLQLENLSIEEIQSSSFWNKTVFDEYAKKESAVLMLYSFENLKSENVSDEILKYTARLFRTSRPFYKKKQSTYDIPWCIACVATKTWADKLFPNEEDNVSKLWHTIYQMCLIDKADPIQAWDEKNRFSQKKCDFMNEHQFQYLKYKNSLGTYLTIELPKNHIWEGGVTKSSYGENIIVNMPTEEIFTSPSKLGTNGIVYSSKPLIYNGVLINHFMIKFENGKVVDFSAEEGYESLKGIITSDEGSCYLGEVALVDYDSPISQSGIIFYETLYDENAACHLALGNSFLKCLEDGSTMPKEELENIINDSNTHVDFMIGTEDLEIIGIDKKGKETIIMQNGNFIQI